MQSISQKNEVREGFRILVVEDNLINQKVIRIILDREGYQYEIATDGVEAIEKFANGDFQLVLMDCQMPNLDGLDACKKIREIEERQSKIRCPIVAMTANAMKGERERCLSFGMDDFLAKPFKSFELVSIIQIWNKK